MTRGGEIRAPLEQSRCPLTSAGPDPNQSYTVCKPSPKPEEIVSSRGDVVSVSLKYADKQPMIFSFIIGERQARPWIQELATGIAVDSTATLVRDGNQVCSLTVMAITKAAHLTKEQFQTRADEWRKQGNDAFRAAQKFKEYRSALLTYSKALDASHMAADRARVATVRSNLAMCHLRMNQWVNVVADCDAMGKPDAKSFYRRAQANIELDAMVRAIRDMRGAKHLVPDDAFVVKETSRVEEQTIEVINKRRQNFAETYSIMVQSSIFKNPIVD